MPRYSYTCDEYNDHRGGYTVITSDESWGSDELTDEDHEAACDRATEWLEAHQPGGFDITFRPIRAGGEVSGIHMDRPDGTLQILGYSVNVPEVVERLVQDAYEHACNTWPE